MGRRLRVALPKQRGPNIQHSRKVAEGLSRRVWKKSRMHPRGSSHNLSWAFTGLTRGLCGFIIERSPPLEKARRTHTASSNLTHSLTRSSPVLPSNLTLCKSAQSDFGGPHSCWLIPTILLTGNNAFHYN